jgi:hypothetical protein
MANCAYWEGNRGEGTKQKTTGHFIVTRIYGYVSCSEEVPFGIASRNVLSPIKLQKKYPILPEENYVLVLIFLRVEQSATGTCKFNPALIVHCLNVVTS